MREDTGWPGMKLPEAAPEPDGQAIWRAGAYALGRLQPEEERVRADLRNDIANILSLEIATATRDDPTLTVEDIIKRLREGSL